MSRSFLLVVLTLFVQIPLASTLSSLSTVRSLSGTRYTSTIKPNSRLFVQPGDDDVPSMDWLTDTLSTTGGDDSATADRFSDESMSDLNNSPYLEEHSVDGDLGDVPIPTTGVSVADEMDKAAKERFYTQLVPITGLGKGVKAVRILSSTAEGAYESIRYLVRLTRKPDEVDMDLIGIDLDEIDLDDDDDEQESESNGEKDDFVMVDVPPFSDKLVQEMKKMMGPNGKLSAILVTCQECIHYDDSPGVFSVRKADLPKWKKAFPEVNVIAYRMDIPRDCRDSITQRLDGYGPWALDQLEDEDGTIFKESGAPLTVKEWDPDLAEEIMSGKREISEEDENNEVANLEFTPDMIRANEEGKRVLAIYTPGRSFGSMTYVFPELQLCASGFSLPIEDSRAEENTGMDAAGPLLDHRGYITTSKAGMSRQIESSKNFVNTYADRFDVVLTARGDPFYLNGNSEDRRHTLLGIMAQYEKLGMIYEQLGISGN